jgi:hypothetical protein
MKRQPFKLLGVASSLGLFVGIVAALVVLAGSTGRADEQVVRWDIVRFSAGVGNAGGEASAKATSGTNPDLETSTITMTGSGTFEVPEKDEEGDDVTGGGTWRITATTGGVTTMTAGTYKVIGVVLWFEAPGTFPPTLTDNIGNAADARAGLAVLRIKYQDGDRGILVVSCSLVGTPNTVFEGITASKGFTDFWKAQRANFTLFHVMNEEDDE